MPPVTPTGRFARLDRLWQRHGRSFWILHSIWALGTGIVVLWLARERYGFVPWVVGFLLLTWASTLFFSRQPTGEAADTLSARFRRGLASYFTRVLYQETLFFVLPFYAYSVVFPSWNVAFPLLLALLAILACLDLLFDRWLRESQVFGLVFFASVAFGVLNLLLPTLFALRPVVATPVAAVTALVTAAPLAVRGGARGPRSWLHLTAAGLAILVVAIGVPQLVPPVPLRLEGVTFAADLDRTSLEPAGVIDEDADGSVLHGQLVVLARVFAPSNVPARVALDWYVDRALVRSSREVEIVAHSDGFRVWDALRPENGTLAPGVYRIVLRTADSRVFGTASLRLH
jgi:Family of unknown function (DUF5924)